MPEVLRNVRIPVKALVEIDKDLCNFVKNIFDAEKEFLKLSNDKEKICKECKKCDTDDCLISEKTKEHNQKIADMMKSIDEAIFSVLELGIDDIQDINNDLNAAGIYNILDIN